MFRIGAAISCVCFFAVPAVFAQDAQTLKPGDTFRDCGRCPELVVIPAGEFSMGNEAGSEQEKPVHKVKFSKPFAVSKFPVTLAQFREYVDATGWPVVNQCELSAEDGSRYRNPDATWRSPGFEQGDNHPVVCVSWVDAIRYLRWLSKETGKDYRLLSEAEWEYIARAGRSDEELRQLVQQGANYGRSGENGAECCFPLQNENDRWLHTSPVDAYPPNAFGVYDVHSNTMNLVSDCVNADYVGAPADGSPWHSRDRIDDYFAVEAWTNEGLCFGHILRGRSWLHQSSPERWHSRRGWWYPAQAASFYGFRVAASLDE